MKIETARHAAARQARFAPGSALADARPGWARRLAFWGPVAAVAIVGTLAAVLATRGVASPARWPLVGLLALNLLYLGLTGAPSVIGFVLHARGRRRVMRAMPSGLSRTAILMPVHCEEPRAVFAAIEAMAHAIAAAGLTEIDLFVLSDTQDAPMAAAEKACFERTAARLPANGPHLIYRRRTSKRGRKAGNLADFCDRWGDEYDYMLVLDADSLMGAGAIGQLIGLMDANPGVGIIQTVPYPVGRETLFARLQQFSARLYTPLLVEGLTFWQQSDGNYWGHNAILRIAPFRAHCTLPVLPGQEPWGGEILCHDVVEAGLMRAAGWECWVLPEVLESYESLPANLIDFVARERRWCQGNLQHSRLLLRPGLRPVGRFHLAYGIAYYLAGPVALLFLALASLDAALGGGVARAMVAGPAGWGLVATGLLALYAGKLLSLGAALASPAGSRGYGGRLALLAGAVLEQAFAFCLSALLIVAATRFLADLVAGRSVRWDPQPRDDRGIGWAEAWRRMRAPLLAGLAWLLLLPAVPAPLRLWALPLALGLVTALPLAVLTSRVGPGRALARLGLLTTPEERAIPAVLGLYQRLLAGDPAAANDAAPPGPARAA